MLSTKKIKTLSIAFITTLLIIGCGGNTTSNSANTLGKTDTNKTNPAKNQPQ